MAGLASGLFGIGGGILTVPALFILEDRIGLQGDFRLFVSVSLLAIAVSSVVGLLTHHRAGQVRWRLGLALGAGGLLGVAAGAWVDPWIQEGHLVFGFAALLVWTSRRMLYDSNPLWRARGLGATLAVGVLAGAVAKLFGVGGGILMVPALAFGGLPMHAAVATSLVAVSTNSLASSAWNLATLGAGPWVGWGLVLGVGSQVGAFVGARTALRTQAPSLQRLFALLLLAVAFEMVRRAV